MRTTKWRQGAHSIGCALTHIESETFAIQELIPSASSPDCLFVHPSVRSTGNRPYCLRSPSSLTDCIGRPARVCTCQSFFLACRKNENALAKRLPLPGFYANITNRSEQMKPCPSRPIFGQLITPAILAISSARLSGRSLSVRSYNEKTPLACPSEAKLGTAGVE